MFVLYKVKNIFNNKNSPILVLIPHAPTESLLQNKCDTNSIVPGVPQHFLSFSALRHPSRGFHQPQLKSANPVF